MAVDGVSESITEYWSPYTNISEISENKEKIPQKRERHSLK
jgi:hypothetical protein